MLRTRTFVAAALLLAASHGHAYEGSIVSGKVKLLSELPPESGVVASWVEVVVETSGRDARLFLPFMKPDQRLPKAGTVCRFKVSVADIHGFVGAKIGTRKRAFVSDEFSCKA